MLKLFGVRVLPVVLSWLRCLLIKICLSCYDSYVIVWLDIHRLAAQKSLSAPGLSLAKDCSIFFKKEFLKCVSRSYSSTRLDKNILINELKSIFNSFLYKVMCCYTIMIAVILWTVLFLYSNEIKHTKKWTCSVCATIRCLPRLLGITTLINDILIFCIWFDLEKMGRAILKEATQAVTLEFVSSVCKP